MRKFWYVLQKSEPDITWLLTALFILILSITVNMWFLLFLAYGLFLRAQGQRPKYYFFGPDTKQIPIGVVRDAITRQPIPLAVVRLHCKKTNRLLQTKVTNRDGAFEFLLPTGSYFIDVHKVGYDYPSTLNDFGYIGQVITVSMNIRYTFFQEDIFIDPIEAKQTQAISQEKIINLQNPVKIHS